MKPARIEVAHSLDDGSPNRPIDPIIDVVSDPVVAKAARKGLCGRYYK